jgi:hypothetical protein
VVTETRQVLAAAYVYLPEDRHLTHSYLEGELLTLCGRIPGSHLADPHAGDAAAMPTCDRCRAKDTRFRGAR